MELTTSADSDLARRMESEMQRIADEAMRTFLTGVPPPERFWQPRVDVHETTDAIVIKMELAGVDGTTLRVHLSSDDRYLTVSGQRHEQEDERCGRIRCYQLEIYFGPFERQIPIPGDARIHRDGISARYTNGMLIVALPKRAFRPQEARTVTVLES
ncbi:MAG: Hsp20/alpha crystallin family protein [Armatimonadetes bacterium]|nr:Hsp20/alpha crystallin family protein [Armatimonadota bacterium]